MSGERRPATQGPPVQGFFFFHAAGAKWSQMVSLRQFPAKGSSRRERGGGRRGPSLAGSMVFLRRYQNLSPKGAGRMVAAPADQRAMGPSLRAGEFRSRSLVGTPSRPTRDRAKAG